MSARSRPVQDDAGVAFVDDPAVWSPTDRGPGGVRLDAGGPSTVALVPVPNQVDVQVGQPRGVGPVRVHPELVPVIAVLPRYRVVGEGRALDGDWRVPAREPADQPAVHGGLLGAHQPKAIQGGGQPQVQAVERFHPGDLHAAPPLHYWAQQGRAQTVGVHGVGDLVVIDPQPDVLVQVQDVLIACPGALDRDEAAHLVVAAHPVPS